MASRSPRLSRLPPTHLRALSRWPPPRVAVETSVWTKRSSLLPPRPRHLRHPQRHRSLALELLISWFRTTSPFHSPGSAPRLPTTRSSPALLFTTGPLQLETVLSSWVLITRRLGASPGRASASVASGISCRHSRGSHKRLQTPHGFAKPLNHNQNEGSPRSPPFHFCIHPCQYLSCSHNCLSLSSSFPFHHHRLRSLYYQNDVNIGNHLLSSFPFRVASFSLPCVAFIVCCPDH